MPKQPQIAYVVMASLNDANVVEPIGAYLSEEQAYLAIDVHVYDVATHLNATLTVHSVPFLAE